MQLRRAKEEAERKERQERQQKAEASRAKKKADELKKKVIKAYCGLTLLKLHWVDKQWNPLHHRLGSACMLFTVLQLVQEPERTVPRQAEAQSSRAPLQVQSSNVQVPAMAQAVQASSKPVHQPAGPAPVRLPVPQQPQVTQLRGITSAT